MFDNVDINGDGTITVKELHNALIRGQPNSKFDIKTVKLLVNKYDTNHDGEISFEEFGSLFNFLNEEYFKFVMADRDGSETIDSEELREFLEQRGYEFDTNFCTFVVETIKINTENDISFDFFCRIMARFDYLTDLYNRDLISTKPTCSLIPLQLYVRDSFFNEFW